MHEPTRFGDFLLLKKLSEDPLGETYRAGGIQGTSVDELVLLRTYGLAGAGSELAEVLRAEAGQRERRVRAPGLVYALAGGEVGGVPYSTYEYSTGWSLPHLIATAGAAPLERDHGLLIVERLAKGLAVVHQADPSKARCCHGFVVPQHVRLSSEGEICLMGFEAGPTLARLAAGGAMAELYPFLSPEVRSGASPTPADDVYALGAVLWQLLIGKPPPLETARGLTASLATARMSNNEMLPAGLGELLQSSLAPQRVRLRDANQWYQKLSAWMGRNRIATTHFDLAFFIHEIFRTAIRRDQEEIEKELQLGQGPPAQAAPEEPEVSDIILRPDLSGMVQRPPMVAQMTDATPASGAAEGSPGRSKAPLFGLVALLAAAAAGGWYLFGRGSAPPEPAPVQAPPPVPAAPPPSVDELQIAQGELERLVQEKARGLGDQIAAEYDEQIRSLRAQLKAAQEAEAQAVLEASKKPQPGASTPDATAPGTTSPPPAVGGGAAPQPTMPSGQSREDGPEPAHAAPSAAPPPPAPFPPAPASDTPSAAAPPGVDTPGAVDTPGVDKPGVDKPGVDTTGVDTPEEAPPGTDTPPDGAAPPEVPPAVTPPPPSSDGAASPPPPHQTVIPPRRIRMPDARYPERARQYHKEATVLIKVLVDTQGKVIDAQPVLKQTDTFGFYQEAMRAARGAEFKPAMSGDAPIRMWTTVVITFKLTE